ncbi:MAG: GNAT family N-acetyltransferase [Pseudomonadota bacterium]
MSAVALGVQIREGRAEDAAAAAAILNAWIDATPWMPRIHSPADVARHYRETVFAERSVLVAGDPIMGFLALDDGAACVTALYLSTPGQGIGKALLDRAKVGRARLELWTFLDNRRARRFYAREGFAEIQRTDGDNEEGLPDVLLRWERGDG